MEQYSTQQLILELQRRGAQHLKTNNRGKYICEFKELWSLYPGNEVPSLFPNQLIISGQNTKGQLTILVIKEQ